MEILFDAAANDEAMILTYGLAFALSDCDLATINLISLSAYVSQTSLESLMLLEYVSGSKIY